MQKLMQYSGALFHITIHVCGITQFCISEPTAYLTCLTTQANTVSSTTAHLRKGSTTGNEGSTTGNRGVLQVLGKYYR